MIQPITAGIPGQCTEGLHTLLPVSLTFSREALGKGGHQPGDLFVVSAIPTLSRAAEVTPFICIAPNVLGEPVAGGSDACSAGIEPVHLFAWGAQSAQADKLIERLDADAPQ